MFVKAAESDDEEDDEPPGNFESSFLLKFLHNSLKLPQNFFMSLFLHLLM